MQVHAVDPYQLAELSSVSTLWARRNLMSVECNGKQTVNTRTERSLGWTWRNSTKCLVNQGMFALREINQMEREMCSYFESLRDFQNRVLRDFAGPGPYPPTVLAQRVPSSTNLSSSSPILAFAPRVPSPKDAPVIPSSVDDRSQCIALFPPIPQRRCLTRLLLRYRRRPRMHTDC